MHYHIVADDAFPLRLWLMKPYPMRNLTLNERMFNYRLSRARRVVENAFGILSHRFRCLLTCMLQWPENVRTVVFACCLLHNYIRKKHPSGVTSLVDREDPESHQWIPGRWHTTGGLRSLETMRGNNTTQAAKEQRNLLQSFYCSPFGSLPWQHQVI